MAIKQVLMTELLDARRHIDLIKVVHLYREHVNETINISREEIRELEQVLIRFIDDENLHYMEISSKSYLHHYAFQEFYDRNPKKTKMSIDKKIKELKAQKAQEEEFSETVTSLKKLKPYLEARCNAVSRYY